MNVPMEYTGLKFTEQHEGIKYQAYRDSGGIWTCGYGHTDGVGPSTTCDDALANEWLAQDMQTATNAVNRLVTVDLSQHEFDALVDFTFNVGAGAFAKSTMLELLNRGDYSGAAGQFERWDLCDGKVVAGLLHRRVDEAAFFSAPAQGG